MIKALFDTNVLVSGFVSFKRPTRPPAQLLHLWQAGLFELCTSEHIIAEFTRTLQRPYFRSRLEPEDINEAMVLLNEDCKVIPITNLVQGITTHPEDDLVISRSEEHTSELQSHVN